ncbi:zinc finger protein CONSTANS-LIKE 13-like [Olea europaea var. sylvestris]|uniref:zinc finger protein CONSTANS-LIKE 13-like n=1 Tax=Olea europaea var. sylvestris TaxID=158386 RepID=UPI000C1D3DB5|nr:zinc finger protein CONSTANS-LIKE 13-like [Olea europaea var. sylvestris]XP_022899105.1 zinc finger protein CONSTANS-LIKE 13-like [Olea europaea var. sylvestris]
MNFIKEQENSTVADSQDRMCDFCGETKALLYCRADSAKLCLGCDREVHSTNQLFKKHTRCLLCDKCDSSPVSIYCCTESLVLCQNCDWEKHDNLRLIHDRRPIEGYNGCPSVSELMSILGFEDLGKKNSLGDGNEGGNEGLFSDVLIWKTPSIVSLDDLIVSSDNCVDAGHSFQSIGVPPLPKNRNAACGKHRQEILCQLREMAKTEPNFDDFVEDLKPHFELEPQGNYQLKDSSRGLEHYVDPALGSFHEFLLCGDSGGVADQDFSSALLGSYIDTNHLVPDKDSDVGESPFQSNGCQEGQSCVPVNSRPFEAIPKVAARELNSQERDLAISRYKEKKKTRRFDKHIRYESRKVRAESRTRIKGRFAKIER